MTRRTLKVWTAEEGERLREMVVADMSLAEIAENLGRTQKAAKTRTYLLRLSLKRVGFSRRALSKQG
jgi:hypothetical protein